MSIWDRPIDAMFDGKVINKSVPSNKNYQYQKLVVTLNDSLPADMYFRTQYTPSGFNLYLFSLSRMQQVMVSVDLNTENCLRADGSYWCNYADLVRRLVAEGLTTASCDDDIMFVPETFDIQEDNDGQ